MNETEFRQRVLENPKNVDQELLDAASANPALQKILQQAQQLESELQAVANATPIPPGLSAKLMAIPSADGSFHDHSNVVSIRTDRNKLYQYLAIAACLVLAVGVSINLSRDSGPSTEDLNFGNSVLAHLYEDSEEIDAINSGLINQLITMPVINEAMANAGTQMVLNTLTSSLSVRSAKPCIIIPAYESAHLLIDGSEGAVSVFVINNSPVNREYSIRDERFDGIVIPMAEGNMILVGEKNEDLSQYKNLFSDNIEWVI